ncbi:MAG: sulfatase/phosphatase domain-containing protein [Planctomycetota bacterium]|jgi:arylsulfatase
MSYGQSWANASNTPFRLFKKFTHEGGIATPLIAYWPAVINAVIKNKGKLTNQVGHIIDIMATCVDVAGTQYPESFNGKDVTPKQGKSLLPIFQGKTRSPHEYLFWEHQKHEAVRHGKWKLVAEKRTKWELYDLEQDRSEMNNLIDKYPQIAQRLRLKYEQWAQSVGVRR